MSNSSVHSSAPQYTFFFIQNGSTHVGKVNKVNPGSLSESKLYHDENVNQIGVFPVDHVTEHTWTALFFECLVDQHKVYHYRACRVLRVGEHIELLHTMFLVLFLGINRRKLQIVLSCPFFCQQKFLKIQEKKGLLGSYLPFVVYKEDSFKRV